MINPLKLRVRLNYFATDLGESPSHALSFLILPIRALYFNLAIETRN